MTRDKDSQSIMGNEMSVVVVPGVGERGGYIGKGDTKC